ncbi:MAG: SRPBCC family protein [Bacteroidales bacterium]|nr:SRPBCC family protein [Bacteroidales bacterium]
MNNNKLPIIFLTLLLSSHLQAQSWNFIKEKDSIKIYTRAEAGKSLKSYRGVTDINAPVEKIFTVMEDVNNTDWWDKNLTQIRVLLYEKNKRARYYLVYDLPVPVTDRDLCVDVTVTINKITDERIIDAVALNGVIPEKDKLIRITEYRQTWTITPIGKERTHVVLEGFLDPAGAVPDWLSNMLLTDTPFKAIRGLREKMSNTEKSRDKPGE